MWTIIFFTSWECSSFVMGNDNWLSHLIDEIQPKCEKSPPKSSKNEKLIFILRLTSDDWPSDPISSKMKCLFLDYVQILMISKTTQAMKVNQNVTKCPLSHRTMKCSFLDYIKLPMISHAIQVTKVD